MILSSIHGTYALIAAELLHCNDHSSPTNVEKKRQRTKGEKRNQEKKIKRKLNLS